MLAKVIDLGKAHSARQSIYDPSLRLRLGSLLLKAHDEARSETGVDLAMHGQEMDNATASLVRMNMVLHDCPGAVIHRENTLASPFFKAGRQSLEDVRLHGCQSAVLYQGLG